LNRNGTSPVGARQRVRYEPEIAPPDRVGLNSVRSSFVTDDERSYAYGFTRQLSTLFLVESKK